MTAMPDRVSTVVDDSILIVNPNTNAATTAMLVGAVEAALASSEFSVRGETATRGPGMIITEDALADAVQSTVEAAVAGVEAWRPRAVIVGAFGDPGLGELRARLSIPVVGIGHAAVSHAAAWGQRFAIATTTRGLDTPLRRLASASGSAGDFVGVFYTDSEPLELATRPEAMVAELGEAADAARDAGAQSVVIGGGPLSDSARALALRADVEVVEPVPCAVRAVLDELRIAGTGGPVIS